ncbi:zinc knuckle, partial [Colletotrichum lupini]
YFKKSTTVILRKLGKNNYIVPKVYRLIALFNIVNKIINTIIVKKLSYLAKTYRLLLNSYISKKRRRLIEYVLY